MNKTHISISDKDRALEAFCTKSPERHFVNSDIIATLTADGYITEPTTINAVNARRATSRGIAFRANGGYAAIAKSERLKRLKRLLWEFLRMLISTLFGYILGRL